MTYKDAWSNPIMKKITPGRDTSTAHIDKHILTRMRTLALWQERTIKDVMQEACDTYIHMKAHEAFKEHIKKQGQVYGQIILKQSSED